MCTLMEPLDVHSNGAGQARVFRCKSAIDSDSKPATDSDSKPATDSDSSRPPIPTQVGHRFRRKSATDSDASRPPIPTQVGHRFRRKSAIDSDSKSATGRAQAVY